MPRRSLPQTAAAAYKSPAPKSQENSPTQNGVPPKRARMEDTVAFENYFLKKKDAGRTRPPGTTEAEPVVLEAERVSDGERKEKHQHLASAPSA
ncbi:hypothetical protein JRQ81_009948 [Phrynocephalus forsythii]|uniref:Uncharacterized protein n=1 Tax=Phrynocephalus forsythii TaxID=171643 RepID=A0A9Q1B7M5_9SAUR|nr:hypothetical protein JRQ81_009948 [Phrynocephalus forsythii]